MVGIVFFGGMWEHDCPWSTGKVESGIFVGLIPLKIKEGGFLPCKQFTRSKYLQQQD